MQFQDRSDAGRQLAERLQEARLAEPVVLALPRGGVPVAFEVAAALDAPLEVFVARKIGAPGHEELGIAAIAEGLPAAVAGPALAHVPLGDDQLEALAARERQELERRVHHYRGQRPLPPMAGRDVVLVDDGLATGVTAEAGLEALRRRRPGRLLLAVPVCAPDTAERLRRVADDVVCVLAPPELYAIGAWYEDFTQTTDAEVLDLLDRARTPAAKR